MPDSRARGLPKSDGSMRPALIRSVSCNSVNSNSSLVLPITPEASDIIVGAVGVNESTYITSPLLTGFMFSVFPRSYDSTGGTSLWMFIGTPVPGYAGAFGTSLTASLASTANRCFGAAIIRPRGGMQGILGLRTETLQPSTVASVSVSMGTTRPPVTGGLWVAAAFIDGGNGTHYFDGPAGWVSGTPSESSLNIAVWSQSRLNNAIPPNPVFRSAGSDSWNCQGIWMK